MEVEVTQLTRRGSAVMRRSHRVSADRIRFGRAAGNEVPLTDIRVELAAAALYQIDGTLYIQRLGLLPLRVNGNTVDNFAIKPGDTIRVGPYQLQMTEPPAGCDAALTIELVQPMGDALAQLTGGVRLSLADAAVSRRTMSWIGFVLVAVLFFAVPIWLYSSGRIGIWEKGGGPPHPVSRIAAWSWNPGEVSNPHRFFASDCATCHRASFTAVPDDACLGCHTGVAAHTGTAAAVQPFHEQLDATRCTHCHEEHRGQRGTIIRAAALCVDCHGGIADKAPDAGIRNVGGFPNGHPQFRATLVADPVGPKLERPELGTDAARVNRPGLKFAHAVHLVEGGFPQLGYKQLACADCHKPEPGGLGFLPITFKGQCASCHQRELTFDKTDLPWPRAAVPHGDDAGIVAAVWNYYAGKTLRDAPSSTSGSAPSGGDVLTRVRDQARSAIATIIGDANRGCAYCHYGTGPQGSFDTASLPLPGEPQYGEAKQQPHFVAPVRLQTRFLPHAQFNHARHSAMACGDCHQHRAAEAKVPTTALGQLHQGELVPELLDIPGKDNCVGCHGGENTTVRAESTCITCHVFHRDDLGPMRRKTAAAQ